MALIYLLLLQMQILNYSNFDVQIINNNIFKTIKMKKLVFIILFSMTITASFAQKFKWNNNKVIAHRGAWKANALPQNSIASLKEAVRIGCYGSEFDVWLTSDNVMVVNHDPTFYGLSVENSTYKQLLEKSHPNGEKIPTLEEYIKEGKKQKTTKLILEIKPSKISVDRTLDLTKRVVELVNKLKAKEWVDYISFSYESCKKIVELDANAKVQYLNGEIAPDQLKADKMAGADYNYSVFKKKPNWIAELKALGLVSNVWTVNSLEDIKLFLSQNVDFITTNEPELLFKELENK
jgi:glycerophosphoryl diester phosphodiesterase